MSKLKTKKSVSKRFKVSKRKKLLKRPVNQDHFNAKESGHKTRSKRKLRIVAKADYKTIKKLIPYAC